MPSRKTKQILQQFRTHFQADQADIPLSLRQESPDIVFRALLEEDEGPMGDLMPMLGYDPNPSTMPGTVGDPAEMVESLLSASREPGQDPAAAPPPMMPAEPQQGGTEPEMPMPGLDEILGMM